MAIYDCPPMSWDEFIRIPDGTQVFNHGASECVALANQYNEGVLGGGFVAVGAAVDWWFNLNVANVHGFTRIDSNPQVGDIFVASGDIYDGRFGHIGVVIRAWDGSTFGTIEQNAGIANAVTRHDRTMANVDGFLRPINQAPIAPAPPALSANQRQAGPAGVFRREAPSSQSARLDGDLEPNEVGNFVGWIYGEDVGGNPVWFQGVSGNWFWSGAFTNAGTDGLPDLNPAPAPEPVPVVPVTPTPAPVEPTPVPTVKPENIEHKEKPVAKLTEQEIAEINARQVALASQLKPADLGSIITNNKARKIVWAVYGIIGLAIIGFMGGLTATGALAPEWFMFATGAYTALGPAFSSLAMANITTKEN